MEVKPYSSLSPTSGRSHVSSLGNGGAVADPNDDARILTDSAAIQADRGSLEAALEIYEKAIQINEGFVPAILGAASCLRGLDRTSQAGVLLRRCDANDPQYAEVLDALGLIQYSRNRHDLAIPLFDQALQLFDP